jgi:hypothetical protein
MRRGGRFAIGARAGGSVLAVVALGALLSAGCGEDEADTSPSELRRLLIALPDPRVEIDRRLDWEEPAQFVAQGLSLADSIEPAQVVGRIDEAGFEAGTAKVFTPASGTPRAHEEVVKFESPGGARTALDYLHSLDRIRPCTGCGMLVEVLPLEGVPGGKAARHSPRPGGEGSYEQYMAEFTVGPYLFIGRVGGPPGVIPPAAFFAGIRALHEVAQRRSR